MISFFLKVIYKAPSQEKLFLENGWGIRDLRGPYLNSSIGFLKINDHILLKTIGSTITMTLSASNRCPVAQLPVKVVISDRSRIVDIGRNSSIEIVLNKIIASQNKISIEIIPPLLTSIGDYWDIVSIDEIVIERYCK